MKRIFALIFAALLCLSFVACAEEGVQVEVIKMDGVSVVVMTSEATLNRARSLAKGGQGAGFVLPEKLTIIEDSAFEGIGAAKVEVSLNVTAIEASAFADCKNLREITIPATVKQINDRAFIGCENVTVYGVKGSEAERIAKLYEKYGFKFQDVNITQDDPPVQYMPAAPLLPPAPLN